MGGVRSRTQGIGTGLLRVYVCRKYTSIPMEVWTYMRIPYLYRHYTRSGCRSSSDARLKNGLGGNGDVGGSGRRRYSGRAIGGPPSLTERERRPGG
jgi:hypothetical protein